MKLKNTLFFLSILFVFTAFGQTNSDSISIKKKHKEVSVSATKSSKSLDAIPFPGSIISKKEINQMKSGVIIINTSRGQFLDENALFDEKVQKNRPAWRQIVVLGLFDDKLSVAGTRVT